MDSAKNTIYQQRKEISGLAKKLETKGKEHGG